MLGADLGHAPLSTAGRETEGEREKEQRGKTQTDRQNGQAPSTQHLNPSRKNRQQTHSLTLIQVSQLGIRDNVSGQDTVDSGEEKKYICFPANAHWPSFNDSGWYNKFNY